MTWARMRSLSVLLVMLIPVFACARPSGPEADAAVTAVLDKFYGAMKTGDTVTAMSTIAPDAVFLESGRLETREEYERSEEHTSELQSLAYLVCRLLLEKKKQKPTTISRDTTT